jgi:hypothetical protein
MRTAELEARRRALLARCDAQRAEIARRVSQFAPGMRWSASAGSGADGGGAPGVGAHHPLAWLAALAGLLMFGRTRKAIKMLMWARTAVALASRTAQVMSLLGALRGTRRTSAKA